MSFLVIIIMQNLKIKFIFNRTTIRNLLFKYK